MTKTESASGRDERGRTSERIIARDGARRAGDYGILYRKPTVEDKLYTEAYRRQFVITDRILTERTDLDVRLLSQRAQLTDNGHSDDTNSERNHGKNRIDQHKPPVPVFYMDGKHVSWGEDWVAYWLANDTDYLIVGLIAANMHEVGHFKYSPHPKTIKGSVETFWTWLVNAQTDPRFTPAVRATLTNTKNLSQAEFAKLIDDATAIHFYLPPMILANILEDSRIEALLELEYPGMGEKIAAFVASTMAFTLGTLDKDIEAMALKLAQKGRVREVARVRKYLSTLLHFQAALLCMARPCLRHTDLFKYAWKRSRVSSFKQKEYERLFDDLLTCDVDPSDAIIKFGQGTASLVSLTAKFSLMLARDLPGCPRFAGAQMFVPSPSAMGGTAHPDVDSGTLADQVRKNEAAQAEQEASGKEAIKNRKEENKIQAEAEAERAEAAEEYEDDEDLDGDGSGDGDGDADSEDGGNGAGSGSADGEGDDNDGDGSAADADDDDDDEYEGSGGAGAGTGKRSHRNKPRGYEPDVQDMLDAAAEVISNAKANAAPEIARIAAQSQSLAYSDSIEIPSERGDTHTAVPTPSHRAIINATVAEFRKLTVDVEPGYDRMEPSGRFNVNTWVQSRGRNFEVFDRWNEGKLDNTSIEGVVLLDRSGSMSGARIDAAARGGWIIKRTLEAIDGKCSVLTFDYGWNRLYSVVERTDANEVIVPIAEGGTRISGALTAAIAKMGHSTCANRVVFILTDGEITDASEMSAMIIEAKQRLGVTFCLYELTDPRSTAKPSVTKWNDAIATSPTSHKQWHDYGCDFKAISSDMDGLPRMAAAYVRQVAMREAM